MHACHSSAQQPLSQSQQSSSFVVCHVGSPWQYACHGLNHSCRGIDDNNASPDRFLEHDSLAIHVASISSVSYS